MNLSEQINNDIVSSMKSKDSFTLSVLRMVKGAIQLEKIAKSSDLTDDEVIGIISKQIKMRNDSIKEFAKGNREDLIEQYQKEIEVLNKYMPKQLSIDEINTVIDEAINMIKPTSSKEFGLIMKEVSPKLRGRADMGQVNIIIKDKLAKL